MFFGAPYARTKFRRTACAIPVMSFIGNFLGVTTQAVFVESMIVVFAGGKTGLSSVVTGALYGYAVIRMCWLMVVARCRHYVKNGKLRIWVMKFLVVGYWDVGNTYGDY